MLDQYASIGEWVQAKREGLGLTQQSFAVLLGMPEAGERTVRGWELGEHAPSPAKQAQIESLPEKAPFKSPYIKSSKRPKFRFIDLFAGIGGIRLPYQKMGGECVFTSEWTNSPKRPMPQILVKSQMGILRKLQRPTYLHMMFCWRGFPAKRFLKPD